MEVRTRTVDSAVPEAKVSAATVATAVGLIISWVVKDFFDIDVPDAVIGALIVLLTGLAGWFAPHTKMVDDSADLPH